MTAPGRIRLSRAKGWRLPPGAVSVARPGKWGNPFTLAAAVESGYATPATAQAFVAQAFRDWIGPAQQGRDWWQGPQSDARRRVFVEDIAQLRGKSLACWCAPDQPCHADVLLQLANLPVHPLAECERAYPDDVCGCPVEEWLCEGVNVTLHYEPDGQMEAFIDAGDWEHNLALKALDMAGARDEAFAWVRALPSEVELAANR